ncbi:glutathione S-transferase family protein [Catenovulum sp. SM1970]|uniref:glutathione S-transferase family protein n=1 Tax=Marinifaba aquimaris TaxID=2741323 RepID=UPI001571BA9B|nr:glutathione S-transferase family protein [Marinifaba aquimaris]NTS77317.1 glutathione S-transferase family protein [Marinifaba aquimaris]
MVKVYGDLISGNCYKIKLLLELLSIEHEWVDIDILEGETQTPDFLAKNPNGKVPIVELSDGRILAESNAILCFFAQDSNYLPTDNYLKAKVLSWLFFEQYSHEPYIAVARYINLYLGLPDDRKAEYESKQEGGHKALKVIEDTLKQSAYLVGAKLTIADISLFAYTHVAHQGGFDLYDYPNIKNWIARIETTTGFISMDKAKSSH